MSGEASAPFEPTTPQAKALMTAVREEAKKLQTKELEWTEKVKCKEEELESRSAKLAEGEKNLKQQLAELEQQKKKIEEAQSKHLQDSHNFECQMSQKEKHLQQQKDDFESALKQVSALFENDQFVQIDIGGCTFKTCCNTLRRFPESTLAQLVNAKPDLPKSMFIDRDGQHFNFILNYLRSGDEDQILDLIAARKYDEGTLMDILEEAKFYNLKQLVKVFNWAVFRHNAPLEMPYLISEGLFVADAGSSYTYVTKGKEPAPPDEQVDLRCLNFTGTKFNQVHFKHGTSFQGSVLERSVFSKCKFEALVSFVDADLRKAKFVECEFTVPILVTGANRKNAMLSSSDVCE